MNRGDLNVWIDRLAEWHRVMSLIGWELSTLCPHLVDPVDASRNAELAHDIVATADRLIPVTQLLRKAANT